MYVCDADCLINLHRHFGRKAISALRHSDKKGDFKLPEGVVRELIHSTDKLGKFVQQERQHLEVSASRISDLHTEIPRLERLYGEKIRVGTQEYAGFWHSKAGRRAADAQVIAVAKMSSGTVVSDDRAVKLACALEGVPCIGWSEFARRLGLIGPEQLNLGFA
jgi:predicted nucleic acid-binding protein